MLSLRAWAAAALCLAAALGTAAKPSGKCPAKRWLSCAGAGAYQAPNLAAALIPDLRVVASSTDLRRVLPLSDAVELLGRKMPQSVTPRGCSEAVLQGTAVRKLMGRKRKKGSSWQDALAPCSQAPFPASYGDAYIFGAWADLGALTRRDLKGLPSLAAFKDKHSGVGPSMGFCLASNPCRGNVFLGMTGFAKHVVVSRNGVSLAVLPSGLFYSKASSLSPPEWRGKGAPSFWQPDPSQPRVPGVDMPMATLSSNTGRFFFSGTLSQERASRAVLPGAKLDLGGQRRAWALWRDEMRLAVSLKLDKLPDVVLWGKLFLPLSNVTGIRGVDVLTRQPTDQVWLRASNQSVLASTLLRQLPEVAAIVRRVYGGALTSRGIKVQRVDLYAAGSKGATLRLRLAPATFNFTRMAQVVTKVGRVRNKALTLEVAARPGTYHLRNAVALRLGTSNYYLQFCTTFRDCDASRHGACHPTHKVCVPRSAGASGAGIAGVGAAPAAPAPQPFSRLLGERCSVVSECQHPLNCAVDPRLGYRICTDKMGRA